MTVKFDVRAYQPGDEYGLVDLFRRCFGRESSLAHWRWKMQSCEVQYDTMWVATVGDRLVGQYVGTQVPAWFGSRQKPAIAIFDTMVDPGARRMGVLTRVGQAAHDHWRQAGVQYGFGLPNQQWGTRAAALGWVPLFPLRWLVRVLRPESILARRSGVAAISRMTFIGAIARRATRRARPNPGIRVRELREAEPHLDEIASLARRPNMIELVRGARWVDYRYLRCPSVDYRVLVAMRHDDPVGYAVYKLRGAPASQAVLAEVITADADEAAFVSLVSAVEKRCLAEGANTIRALAVPDTTAYARLGDCGFVPGRAEFSLQYVPFAKCTKDRHGVDDWHFEGGDFDVV